MHISARIGASDFIPEEGGDREGVGLKMTSPPPVFVHEESKAREDGCYGEIIWLAVHVLSHGGLLASPAEIES